MKFETNKYLNIGITPLPIAIGTRGGAQATEMAGVCHIATSLNTPLHPSQEGNRTGRVVYITHYLLSPTC